MIAIEVTYASPETQDLRALSVPEGSTVEEVVRLSGLLERFPEVDLAKNKVGIFSQPVALSQPVQAGDRVEIYRPLTIDPKQARQLRAQKRKSA
jgi:hypothetical protein